MDNPTREEESGLFGRTPQQRGPLPSILFVMLMLLLFTSHNGEEFLARHQYQEALRKLTYQKSNFTAWMDGDTANFSLPEQNVSVLPLLETFLPSNGSMDPIYSSYYQNITGFIHGDLHLYNITPPYLANSTESYPSKHIIQDYMKDANENMTEILEKLGVWNWSAPQKVAFSVVEKIPLLSANSSANVTENIALIHGRIEFSDASIGEDLRLEFEGVHFLKNGTIYGLAEPPNRAVDIRLLPSIVPEDTKSEIALLIEPELSSRIDKLKNLIDAGIIEDSLEDLPPKTACPFNLYAQIDSVDVPAYVIEAHEEEIQRPTGIRTNLPTRLTMKSILISKECGVLYEISNMEGLRSRTFFRKVTTYGTEFHALRDFSSISIYISFLAEGRPSLSLIAPSFLACVIFLYEAQFSMNIHQIQLPEDAPPPRPPVPVPAVPVTAPSPVPGTAPQIVPTPSLLNTDLPTDPPNAPPAPIDNAPAPTAATQPATLTPAPPQNVTFWTFFWQQFSTINTYNYHPPLPLPDEESPEKSLGDCAICMDAIIVDPSLRQTHDTSASSGNWDAKASGADGRRITSNIRAGGGAIDPTGLLDAFQRGVGSAVTRKSYSLAPCHHLFHTECLERWLAIKNICPQCRRPLPPL
ncbi:hypothetical protein HHX47_DHR6000661 [Lentinula edodes]|nr:hypothetical protein HHX47_DHR6000661 [Lentinula edodes]